MVTMSTKIISHMGHIITTSWRSLLTTSNLRKDTLIYLLNSAMALEDGFIIQPPYMDIHLSYALRSVIGQLRTSSHQLEIEVGRYTRIPVEERICQLCHQEVESEEHYVCHCSVFYEIRGRYHCLFKQGFGP